MTGTIVLILLGLLALFLLYVATRPATFLISRRISIDAPPAEVFPYVNDLNRGQEWSPWKKLDPAAVYTFSGPAQGTGSSMDWSGNKHIGAGRQTITESREPELVRSRVEFFRPFKGESEAVMELMPQGAGTLATWSLAGNNNFISKLFCTFMNQDKMLGGSLEDGLAQLKQVVEAQARR